MFGGSRRTRISACDFQVGQAMVADIISALTVLAAGRYRRCSSATTNRAASTNTIAPQPACVPDDYAPQIGPTDAQGASIRPACASLDRGVTVRQARLRLAPGHRSHEPPALRRVAASLPALTHRDANAVPLFDNMFDFTQKDTSVRPCSAMPSTHATQQAACRSTHRPRASGLAALAAHGDPVLDQGRCSAGPILNRRCSRPRRRHVLPHRQQLFHRGRVGRARGAPPVQLRSCSDDEEFVAARCPPRPRARPT